MVTMMALAIQSGHVANKSANRRRSFDSRGADDDDGDDDDDCDDDDGDDDLSPSDLRIERRKNEIDKHFATPIACVCMWGGDAL